jgi:hypothetical protein
MVYFTAVWYNFWPFGIMYEYDGIMFCILTGIFFGIIKINYIHNTVSQLPIKYCKMG